MRFILIFVSFFLLIASCKKIDLYEKNSNIPNQEWDYAYKPSFNFTITDTSSLYNIFIVLRHTDAYEYNNIWLNLETKIPADTATSRNIQLSLGNDNTGWEGKGMDDIYEVRKAITVNGPMRFKRTGEYIFTLSQVMRDNPLRHVLSAGVRVEKVVIQ